MPLPSCWRTSIATTRWRVTASASHFPSACVDGNRSGRSKSEILLGAEHLSAARVRITSSTSQQHHDAHAVPCRTLDSLRWGALHRHDSEILWIELEPLLNVLPNRHGTAAGDPELIGGNAAVCVAVDDNGAICKGLAELCERPRAGSPFPSRTAPPRSTRFWNRRRHAKDAKTLTDLQATIVEGPRSGCARSS